MKVKDHYWGQITEEQAGDRCEDYDSGKAWVEDIAAMVVSVLIIVCLCGAFMGLYWAFV